MRRETDEDPGGMPSWDGEACALAVGIMTGMVEGSVVAAAEHRSKRRSRSFGAVALAAGLALAFVTSPLRADGFYNATAAELRGRPGTVIRAESFPGAPSGATAHKVLYRSTGLRGEPIAVSGVIVVPSGPVPAGGRPVVAWAHGTTGVARKCAPSLNPHSLTWIPGLSELLARGYVVAATDYPGLGTAGTHPYLVGESEGRAVLDSVRAARDFDAANASGRFAVWGHSQGGHAALFAGQLARSYAPELRLAGIAAAAPATDLGALFKADVRSPVGKVLGAFALWSWSRVFNLPLDAVVLERVRLVLDRVASLCNDSPRQVFSILFVSQAFEREGFLAVDVTQVEPWRGIMRANTPDAMPANVPLLLVQGTADRVVRPAITDSYLRFNCARGTRVQYTQIPGGDHNASAKRGAASAVAWISERFAGQPAPNDC